MRLIFNLLPLLNFEQKKSFLILFFLTFFTVFLEVISIGSIVPVVLFFLGEQLINVKFFFSFSSDFLTNLSDEEIIKYILIFIFFAFLLKNLLLIYVVFLESRISWSIEFFFRKKLFKKFLKENLDYHSKNDSSFKINMIYKECSYIFHGILNFIIITTEIVFSSAIFALLLFYYPKIFLVLFFLILFTILFYNQFTKKKLKDLSKQRQLGDQLLIKRINNGINGIREMKIYNTQQKFLNDFTKNTFELFNVSRLLQALVKIPKIILEISIITGLFFVVGVFIYLGNPPQSILALLSLLVVSAIRVLPSILRLYNSYQALKIAKPSFELITNQFKKDMISKEVNNYINKEDKIDFDFIELKNLKYSIPENKRVLFNNVNFIIKKNEITGIKGESGVGKSTLIDILSTFKKPTHGSILAGNLNIHEHSSSWQKKISYVPQEIFLLDDTVYMNICFKDKSTIDFKKFTECCKKAEIQKFIEELPNGIDTIIGESGSKLSQGQKQRLGIARALYHDPQILILDEATNALDKETEEKVMQIIKKISSNVTTIIVSHSDKPLGFCNKVFEIKNQEINIIK